MPVPALVNQHVSDDEYVNPVTKVDYMSERDRFWAGVTIKNMFMDFYLNRKEEFINKYRGFTRMQEISDSVYQEFPGYFPGPR